MATGNMFISPSFLTASTPQELERVMIKNNLRWGIQFKYFDIQFVNGKWYAWYYLNHKKGMESEVNRGNN